LQDRSLAFVDVEDPCPLHLFKVAVEGEQLLFTHAGLIAIAALPDLGPPSVSLKLANALHPAAPRRQWWEPAAGMPAASSIM
jgi:hypothetical protein